MRNCACEVAAVQRSARNAIIDAAHDVPVLLAAAMSPRPKADPPFAPFGILTDLQRESNATAYPIVGFIVRTARPALDDRAPRHGRGPCTGASGRLQE